MHSEAFPKIKTHSLLTRATGHFCVTVLRMLSHVPPPMVETLLGHLLPIYIHFRRRHIQRLTARFQASPFKATLGIRSYYQMRLHLILRALQYHGRRLPYQDHLITGLGNYTQALASEQPVVLIGLHSGDYELLHRIPQSPPNRPFFILTAPAFAPALSAYMAKGRKLDGKINLSNKKETQPNRISGASQSFGSGIKTMLKSKGILAIMSDQDPTPLQSVATLKLWGRIEVPYPERLFEFLISKKIFFLPVSTRVLANGQSSFTFHAKWELAERTTQNATSQSVTLKTKLCSFLESAIESAPEQWNWSYPKITVLEEK